MNSSLNWRYAIARGLDVITLGFIIASAGCSLAGDKPAKLIALAGGAVPAFGAIYFQVKADEKDPFIKIDRQARIETHADLRARQIEGGVEVQQLPPAPDSPIVPLESVLTTGTGIALLGNSGSGKSSIVQWLIGEAQPENLVVIDPHNDGKTWGDLPVVDDYDEALDKVAELLDELKHRRDRRKKGLPNPTLFIVADEWPSLRAYANKRKNDVCDEFVLLMGCEARKLNIITLLCSQGSNVKAMGLEGQGDFLENWVLVRLGKIAKKYCKNLPDREVAKIITQVAYPCLINDEPSYHPTHGTYVRFANDQQPKGIKPYNPKQIAKSPESENLSDSNSSKDSDLPNINEWRLYLEHLSTLDAKPTPGPGESRCDDFSPPSESENLGESDETQSEEWVSPYPKPDHNPSDGCVRGGDFGGGESETGFTLDESARVLTLRKNGKTKQDIILDLWGFKPGKSGKYKRAKAKYEAIEAYWQGLGLWIT